MIAMLVNIVIGAALIFAPTQLHYADTASGSFDRTMGAMVIVFALLAFWEVLAPVRWICASAGLFLLFSPAWVGIENASSIVVHMIGGLIVISMSLLARKPRHRTNGGWHSLIQRQKTDLGRITWS